MFIEYEKNLHKFYTLIFKREKFLNYSSNS